MRITIDTDEPSTPTSSAGVSDGQGPPATLLAYAIGQPEVSAIDAGGPPAHLLRQIEAATAPATATDERT